MKKLVCDISPHSKLLMEISLGTGPPSSGSGAIWHELLVKWGGLNDDDPQRLVYLRSPLSELLRKDMEVWPCWRRCVPGSGFWLRFHKLLSFLVSALCLVMVSQACLLGVMLLPWWPWTYSEFVISPNKMFFSINYLGHGVSSQQQKNNYGRELWGISTSHPENCTIWSGNSRASRGHFAPSRVLWYDDCWCPFLKCLLQVATTPFLLASFSASVPQLKSRDPERTRSWKASEN